MASFEKVFQATSLVVLVRNVVCHLLLHFALTVYCSDEAKTIVQLT